MPAEAQLADYASLIEEPLREALRSDETVRYLVEPMTDYPTRPGKGIRPALCLATCEAFGGLPADAIPSAVALELIHNSFLIHDDIEDRSQLRRGQPALHRRFGLPLALNAGDALGLWGLGVLRRNHELLGGRVARRIYAEFDFMARQTTGGQALDLGWRIDNRLDLGPDDYLDLIMKKTCWYTTVMPLRIGALIGTRGRANLDGLVDFGFSLGAAFQIQDDILNLVGDPGQYGKEIGGDIREGKRTLVMLHLLATVDGADRTRLQDFLDPSAERSPADIAWVLNLMHKQGSIDFAREFARGIATSALEAFPEAFAGAVPGRALSFLEGMIDFMVERAS